LNKTKPTSSSPNTTTNYEATNPEFSQIISLASQIEKKKTMKNPKNGKTCYIIGQKNHEWFKMGGQAVMRWA
jgi:hypothetical protein